MILTGPEIEREVLNGAITIDPFKSSRVNPNSYNVCLSGTVAVYDDYILDAARENKTTTIEISEDGLLLSPDRIYLGATIEIVGSSEYVPNPESALVNCQAWHLRTCDCRPNRPGICRPANASIARRAECKSLCGNGNRAGNVLETSGRESSV